MYIAIKPYFSVVILFQLKVYINFMQYVGLTYHIRMHVPDELLFNSYNGFGVTWGKKVRHSYSYMYILISCKCDVTNYNVFIEQNVRVTVSQKFATSTIGTSSQYPPPSLLPCSYHAICVS